ncbi:MAG TPA: hypothetical protein DCG57_03360, partial [Candidatus Riflebacteria bacterium]|nr:hypothetical protein [Candidatus Riflebacteria bacterium]
MFKTVLTCGPACASDLLLKKMAQVADGFRLNVAHLVGDKLVEWMTRLQELRQQTGRDFSIVLDLQGAKVRIGSYPAVTD